MTLGTWLAQSSALLTKAGVETARLDCLVLLEDVLVKDRSWLLAHPEYEIAASHNAVLKTQLARRATHEPLAYIRGHAAFYGRTFLLSDKALVPRPETEALIELSKELILNKNIVHVADIGTGSGCIGITLKLELPALDVDLYDVDSAALAVASQNSTSLHASVGVHQSDLLSNLTRSYELIVTNLPYVPDDFPINTAATHEPRLALFSGQDGLDHYRTFWAQISQLVVKPLLIVTESLPQQHAMQTQIATSAGYKLRRTEDFGQQFVLAD